MSDVKVRLPPSPTGFCHVGTARMAVLNYLFATKLKGEIVFRSEDTDKERSTRAYEKDILDSLEWLDISWNEFYRQSERTAIYTAAIEQLLGSDRAYISEEESKKEPGTQVSVVRLRNPGKTITFNDIVRGDITFDTSDLGDFAIARAIDDPLYHLTVVIDDAQMGITHVIRGEEHISNTPRQILIQEALGYERPKYAHYPLFLGTDRSKLSKRKGDVAIKEYREKGYLPDALFNYLATLGWTPPSGREVLTREEMIAEFELTDLHKSGAVFDIEKLNWYNRHYLEKLTNEQFLAYARPALRTHIEARSLSWDEKIAERIVPQLRERISVASDLEESSGAGEFDFFFQDPTLEPARIAEKKSSRDEALRHLQHVHALLQDFSGHWGSTELKHVLWDYATDQGRGAVLWPLRYALSGREKSPDPFTIAGAIGKESSMRRIERAIQLLAAV